MEYNSDRIILYILIFLMFSVSHKMIAYLICTFPWIYTRNASILYELFILVNGYNTTHPANINTMLAHILQRCLILPWHYSNLYEQEFSWVHVGTYITILTFFPFKRLCETFNILSWICNVAQTEIVSYTNTSVYNTILM